MNPAEVAAEWGATGPELVSARENAVYRVRLPDGRAGALRLHRPGYQSDAAIRSELWWMKRLAEAGLGVPRPIRTRDGADLVQVGARIASMVTWLPGHPLGAGDRPLPTGAGVVEGRYRALGAVIARMHDATDALTLPVGFERPRWDLDGFLGETPLWGHCWENPSLDAAEAARLRDACGIARERLEAEIATGADFGLIHADILRENVLVEGETVAVIDFDDAGFGFRAYDLATAEVQGLEDPMSGIASQALRAGYAAARRPDAPPLGDVSLFVALRCFASAGWATTRAAPGDARQRFYAERALRAAAGLTGA